VIHVCGSSTKPALQRSSIGHGVTGLIREGVGDAITSLGRLGELCRAAKSGPSSNVESRVRWSATTSICVSFVQAAKQTSLQRAVAG